VHETIAAFITARFTPAGQLAHDAPLFSSGLVDSFGVLEVITFLEDTFNIQIDPAVHDLVEFDTVNRIADLVARARADSGQ
jgi:acyl carrier protein